MRPHARTSLLIDNEFTIQWIATASIGNYVDILLLLYRKSSQIGISKIRFNFC
ncbi:hypothetical protein KsCSTR_19660 [Candidatus Kuenenia stuttgartiensis]|uniref:Uncharacterized protein n=1 Tax=Kuenenia stuttgartiensis TaxID=174633 RepID=Q1Q2J6_KUEST|nr:hypothetical protein KsCSTR_19660 [Candidatus Kuenenia stuttgartiensis]CAJ74245.1 unknown protein [Candidatus Kuenenia stuttgartiensis]